MVGTVVPCYLLTPYWSRYPLYQPARDRVEALSWTRKCMHPNWTVINQEIAYLSSLYIIIDITGEVFQLNWVLLITRYTHDPEGHQMVGPTCGS